MSGIMLFWIAFVGGLLIGILVTWLYLRITTESGFLLIDQSNPDKEIWRVDLNNNLKSNTKRFMLKVVRNANLSLK